MESCHTLSILKFFAQRVDAHDAKILFSDNLRLVKKKIFSGL